MYLVNENTRLFVHFAEVKDIVKILVLPSGEVNKWFWLFFIKNAIMKSMQLPSVQAILDIISAPPRRILWSRLPSDDEAEEALAARVAQDQVDSHYHRELHLVLQGERLCLVGGRAFRLRPGEAVFIDRWEEHVLSAWPGSEDVPYVSAVLHGHDTMWWHVIRETSLGKFDLVAQETHVILSAELSAFFRRHLDAAMACADLGEATVRLATSVNAAVAEYGLAIGQAIQSGSPQTMPLEMVRSRIAETNGAHCTVKGLAALAGMPATTLDRKFRAAFGCSVRDEIQRVREAYVKMSLVGGHTQKEIAASLGFSAVSNYNRWQRTHDRRSNRLEDIVRTYITHRHGANCSLAELAERFGYSQSRLVHLYRERTGESIGDRVHQARIDYVRAHPELTDAKMAKALGFLSETAYRRWRRQNAGTGMNSDEFGLH